MKKLGIVFEKFSPHIIPILLVIALIILIKKSKNLSNMFFGHEYDSPIKFNAADIAERQMQAMGHFGTDIDLLFGDLMGLSKSQLKKVFEEFNYKPYLWGNRVTGIGRDKNLFEWYKEELSGDDIEAMREIWEKSELDITF